MRATPSGADGGVSTSREFADRAWRRTPRANGRRPRAAARRARAAGPSPSAAAIVPFTIAIERGAPAKQDRLGQRAVQRHLEAFDMAAHQTSAPPPKEKKDRKKLDAAKAIEMPKTIWISRRKPPAVSPKARRQAGDDDDDHGDDLGDRPLHGIEDLLQRLLPRHVRAGGVAPSRSSTTQRPGPA